MKAIRFHDFGGPENLKYEEAPAPTIGPNEVLIEMKAAALNHLDIWVRSGARERGGTFPHIPGSDGSGIISQTGDAVDFIKTGDKVIVVPGISCGHCEHCLSGHDNLCRFYHVFGTKENGTYAAFVKIPASNVLPIPRGLGFNEAAAVPLVFLTAWHMLVGLAKIKPGDWVLVHAAGSGVGSAAIQIAKMFGTNVITTAGSGEKLEKAKELGADEGINYRTKDFTEEVKRLTQKRGVDVVFEHTGGEIFEKSILALTKGGRLVTCGATSDYEAKLDLRYVYSKHLTIYGSFMGSKSELVEVLKFFEEAPGRRQLRPVIDTIFPLEKAAEAHKRMEERKSFGKIILAI